MVLPKNFRYITTDKVEDFCYRMREAGLEVRVDDRWSVWVDCGGVIPEQIHIFEKRSYKELIEEFINKKSK